MFWLFLALVTLLVALTLLPLWRYEVWWVRGQDFPRLQYAIFALLLLPAQWLLLDRAEPGTWWLAAATLACLLYQAWWILPHTPLWRREVKTLDAAQASECLAIMSVNVLMTNRNADALLAIVERARPDVLIALETDAWWQSRLDALERDYPHTMKCPLDNLYGMLLYSRLPLEDGRVQFLVEDDTPSMHAMLVLRSGRRVRLHCVHPKPPSPTENDTSTERDAELIAVAKSVAECEGDTPVIVAGDLNDVAWSATTRLFRKISGLLDPRVGRGMYNTFHADYAFLRWPLDHLFHSAHFGVIGLARLPAFGSDHFPILVKLAFAERLVHAQEGLEPDAGDQQWAAKKAGQEGVSKNDVHTPG